MDAGKLSRYAQLATLLAKYGHSDFLEAVNADVDSGVAPLESAVEGGRGPDDLVADLTELGPTFVKLGQMLSTRSDLLSQPYLDALSSLQDDVEGISVEEVERIFETELDVRISNLFSEFEQQPLAAASLAQVHRARLRDGRRVVVKVQRPGIKEQVIQDLEIVEQVTRSIDRHTEFGRQYEFSRLAEHFKTALLEELDYRREGNNLTLLADQLRDFGRIVIPRPVDDLVSERVLVMDYVEGSSVSSLGPLARMDSDIEPLAKTLCEAYLHQILVVGFFHSDPHPGNILVVPDDKLALIDLGMVAHVEASLRERLLRLLLSLCDAKGRETAELLVELGQQREDANVDRFIAEVADLVTRRQFDPPGNRQLGQALLNIVGIFANNGIRPPVEIGLLGKTLLLLDEVSRTLDPEFDPDSVMRDYAQTILQRQLIQRLKPSEAAGKLLDSGIVVERIPRQLHSVLDALARGNLRLKVDAFDEPSLVRSLERIGNRIALGVVLAALIIGAALMMRVETELTLFGYPALAIALFLAAAVLGFVLAAQIMLAERSERKRRR
ncbi:MAG: AarF/UbiB family protein [Gammaproteobacteria bacterium]|nr:AarF/UbiB family protein [Gammaproteobacteria bacterium]